MVFNKSKYEKSKCCNDDDDSEFISRFGDHMNGTLTLPALIFSGDDGITFFDGTIQSTAYDASLNSQVTSLSTQVTTLNAQLTDISAQVTDISGRVLDLSNNLGTTNINVNTINSKISAISFDSFLNKTTINSDSYINSITCGTIATNSGGDLQAQISSLQEQINALITVPVGTILIFSGGTVPSGYLLCNGSLVLKATYPNLWNVIGSTYATGSIAPPSSSFFIPDLRGLFVRGTSVNTTYNVTGGGSLGTYQSDSVQKHSHKYNMAASTINVASSQLGGATSSVWDNTSSNVNTGSDVYDTNNTTILTDETRPHNISMNYIIKY
jgi:microcystin-dependent protein